jgi:hypothetical protein
VRSLGALRVSGGHPAGSLMRTAHYGKMATVCEPQPAQVTRLPLIVVHTTGVETIRRRMRLGRISDRDQR